MTHSLQKGELNSKLMTTNIEENKQAFQDPDGISIMTDVDLHPLPITPNDPLSIVSTFSISILTFSQNLVFKQNEIWQHGHPQARG